MDLNIIILSVVFVISIFSISIKINYMCDAIRKLEDLKADTCELRNINDKIDRAYYRDDIYGYTQSYTNQQMFNMILDKLDCEIEPEYETCKLVNKETKRK